MGQRLPRLLESLCLCYLATLLLQTSLSLGDIHRWAAREDLVYIRAARFLPLEMRARLPKEYLYSFDSSRPVPKPDDLHRGTTQLAEFYHDEYGMSFPALNAPLLLLRYIRGLALPLSLYPAATRIMELIEPLDALKFLTDGGRGKAFPEARLMSSLVVAVKTCQRFDGRAYRPCTDAEAATLAIDWTSWQQAFSDGETGPGLLARGEELEITENMVFDMTSTQLDQYMDWYERTWTQDARKTVPQGIRDLFPLKEQVTSQHNGTGGGVADSTQQTAAATLEKVLQSASIQQPIPKSSTGDPCRSSKDGTSPIRPGNLYRRFRSVKELDETTRAFFERASKMIGVNLTTLVVALFRMELKLEKWQDGKSKGRISVPEEHSEGAHYYSETE